MDEMGSRIKKLRLNLGLRQVNFAEKARISQGYLAEVEKGKKVPSSRVVLAFSQAFDVDEEWLRSGKGTKKRSEDLELSSDEREFVSLYRRLRSRDQDALVKQMRGKR